MNHLMIENNQTLIHYSLFEKYNFNPDNYGIRAIDEVIFQRRTHYNLQFKELSYNNQEKDYISKDIKKQLSYSILKQICPLYDSIPFVPFFASITETKRLNRLLEEKLTMFIMNERANGINDDHHSCNNNTDNNAFLTKSLLDLLDNDVFIHQPLIDSSSLKYQSKDNLSNKKLTTNSGNATILNDSIEEITKFIVSIQYSEDVRNIDIKKKNQVDLIMPNSNTHSRIVLENYLNRQESRRNTLKRTNKKVNDKVLKEERKYENQILEEAKKIKLNTKFKLTQTFLSQFNKEAKRIKEQGKIFGKIMEHYWKTTSRDYSTKRFNRNDNSSLRYDPANATKKKKNIYSESSDRVLKKSERFSTNLSLVAIPNKTQYPEISSLKKHYCKISLNKNNYKSPLSRNQPKYNFDTSVKIHSISTKTNWGRKIPITVGKKQQDTSQSVKSNFNTDILTNIFKAAEYKAKSKYNRIIIRSKIH